MQRIDPIRVRAETYHIRAFGAAVAAGPPQVPTAGVPVTFPIRWIALPDVRDRISRLLSPPEGLLVQQSQSFHYATPIEPDRDYLLEIECRRDPVQQHRIRLRGTVRELTGAPIVRLETVLRAIATWTAAGASRAPPARAECLPELHAGAIGVAQIERYAAAALDDNPLHRNGGAGREAGFGGPVVPGMLVMGWFEPLVAAWRTDLRIARLYASFLRPIIAGAEVVLGGYVAVREPGGLVLRVFASAGGEVACVGEISASVAPPPSAVSRP
jgi:acyl dehydratase